MFYLVPEKDVVLGIKLVGEQPERWEDVDLSKRWVDASFVWYKGKVGSLLIEHGKEYTFGRLAAFSMECLNDKKLLVAADYYLNMAYETLMQGMRKYQGIKPLEGSVTVQGIDEADLTWMPPTRLVAGATYYDLLQMDRDGHNKLSPDDKKMFEAYL